MGLRSIGEPELPGKSTNAFGWSLTTVDIWPFNKAPQPLSTCLKLYCSLIDQTDSSEEADGKRKGTFSHDRIRLQPPQAFDTLWYVYYCIYTGHASIYTYYLYYQYTNASSGIPSEYSFMWV